MTRAYVRRKPLRAHVELFELALATRFWTQVDKRGADECWLWTGSLVSQRKPGADQYGAFTVQARQYRAHRVSWELANGPIPDGQVVRHRCDVARCVNPRHLELGTQLDNIADMIGRQRHTIGERNRHAKLIAADVMEIRASSEPDKVLAARYGVKHWAINDARSGRKWKHLPGARPDFYDGRKRPHKLTPEQRAEIRTRRRAGESLASVAAAFGVAPGYVCVLAGRVTNVGKRSNRIC